MSSEREGERGQRPLIVGVTGHRVLVEMEKLDRGVDRALAQVARAFPGRPLALMSMLAEGADRLTVRRALSRYHARLIVPLPLPVPDYLADFRTSESKAEFRDLLDRADEVIELPSTGSRDEAYDAAGNYVLENCDVLLAVWDGQRPQGRGGTGAIVTRARQLRLPLAWVRAGNRERDTMRPTSLGDDQGRVSFERLPAIRGDVPYRIRIGAAAGVATIDGRWLQTEFGRLLSSTILELYEKTSRGLITARTHTPIGFSVVASFASEGERVIARAIIQLDEGEIDSLGASAGVAEARLEAVIPEKPDAYLRRFPEPGERGDVSNLLERDAHPVVLSVHGRDYHPDGPPGPLDVAERKHLALYIVDACDVVVALANADPAPSGSEIDPLVALAREKGRPLILLHASDPPHITTETGHGLGGRSIERIEEFNGFAIDANDLEGYVENMYSQTFASSEGEEIPADAKEAVREELLPYYARASLLAKRNQTVYHRAGLAVWGLFPLAVAAVAVGVLVPDVSLLAFAIEFVLLAFILVVVRYADRARSLERWVECRFLTERLRLGMFLAACGVEASSLEAPPYMGGDRSHAWMAPVFNEIWRRLPRLEPCRGLSCRSALRFVEKHWLEDQRRFHQSKVERTRATSERLERAGFIVFLLAMLAALGHVLVSLMTRSFHPLENSLAFLGIALPGIGAAMGGFRTHREYSRLAKRSRNMNQALASIAFDLRYAAESPDTLAVALRRTEQLMLSEVRDWLMLMRFAVVQPPG